ATMGASLQEHELGRHHRRLRPPRMSRFRLLIAITVWLLGGSAGIAFGQGESLPPGEGAKLMLSRCTLCHSLGIRILPHQDRTGWEETVDRMIRFGAPLLPPEREVLIQYLVEHFGASTRQR
ncbi:MAG: hypothetical protein ACK4Z6_06250, partial [Candidatus Methylomirabilales bacterium]